MNSSNAKKKREAHNTSEASQGGNSSAGAGAPSLPDAASPVIEYARVD
ncbi:hypothetical protein BFJ70_g16164 [Fusarium oxysporum]|nr:hypothetical protein BFJ71_g16359 [Fusarium oxysporum]RKL12557.1 hypothetical protein BFJ70_g16164 [Fusarium oxysporum]